MSPSPSPARKDRSTNSMQEADASSSGRRSMDDVGSSHERANRPHLRSFAQSAQMANIIKEQSTYPSPTQLTDSGILSPTAQDRVFPVRSVVSVDPTSTPLARGDPTDGMFGPGAGQGSVQSRASSGSRRLSNASAGEASWSERGSERGQADQIAQAQRGRTERSANEGPRSGSMFSSEAPKPGPLSLQMLNDNISVASSTSAINSAGLPPKSGDTSFKSADDGGEIVTARFKHVLTNGDHAIITGRGGDTLQRCEDEPIHIPGAVQGFGLLIAILETSDGKLQVKIVSENSKRIIGYTPKQLFALDSLSDILSEEQTDNLFDHIEFVKESDSDVESNGPEVFTLSIRHPVTRRSQKLWCAMHVNQNNFDMIVCEFELEDDPYCPLVQPESETPEPPEDTLQSNPTADEFEESTVNASKPLRVLRSARKKKGEAAAMEVFNIMSQIENQLAGAPNLKVFLKILIGVVKELTGFHRVMIYQFDKDFNGRVVTELVDPRATKDLYLGLNFPASDIPKQAREMYKINKVRLLYDREQTTARLVCRSTEELEKPLDLTYSYLRAMSPIHLKYLSNMAVRSSMSISINAFDELWGLIACHAYGGKGTRVSFPIRKMCRLVGDTASRNIERLSYASRLQARKLINTVSTEKNPSGYIVASSEDLLKLFDADYGLLSVRDETKIMGKLDATQEALALLEYFRLRKINSVITSQDICIDFPDLIYRPGFTSIAGLLLVPLSTAGSDFIVFFRKGQLREVKWAGNPYEKFTKEGTEGYLEPRKSFKIWSEKVIGKCREWNEEQIETAAVLCLVYGKFIEVWRQKEAAVQNTQLTRLLLANSAHEVRTPLNAIINYLEIALEGSLDTETRDNLSRSHSASKSLIYVINDLLDLTKTEEGNQVIKDDVFDLPETVKEATDQFSGDAKRKNIAYKVVQNPGVPRLVIGDQRKVRQAISNVTANAIQNTASGSVAIELWLTSAQENHVEIDVIIQDTGVGMSASKLDELLREMEQVQSEGDESSELLSPDSMPVTANKPEKKSLGLGLAIVSRIIRHMNGQLRVKSEEGQGSRFVIQMGFDLPPQGKKQNTLEGIGDMQVEMGIDQPVTTPPVADGEVMLVSKSAQKPEKPQRQVARRASADSMNSAKSSLRSFKSGSSTKSDVDRLIDAIQEPHLTGDTGVQRASSTKGSIEGIASSSRSMRPTSKRSHTQTTETSILPQNAKDGPELLGQALVQDQGMPVKPIKVSDEKEGQISSAKIQLKANRRVSFEPTERTARPTSPNELSVLVAEDDQVNSKIMAKRLSKAGHAVHLTINGEECASAYGEKASAFDVVLMDMQMPIVDGLTSTKMIRSFEKVHSLDFLSQRAALNGRIPIFAVSASLVESQCQSYIDAGFDGWILKPVDFKRLSTLFQGIVDQGKREDCLYHPGEWERGGWFDRQGAGRFAVSTTPLGEVAASSSVSIGSVPDRGSDPFDDPISREQERLRSEPKEASDGP